MSFEDLGQKGRGEERTTNTGTAPKIQETHVGMIGLALMGSSLARNIESKGFSCGVYNLEPELTTSFIESYGSGNFIPSNSLEGLVRSLTSPRQIFIMVKAGKPVDSVLEQLLPLLDPGDIVIDGGNTFFRETERRQEQCAKFGVHLLGVGVSGGGEGALKGPCIMPGGDRVAWEKVSPLLAAIAAKADDGAPCTQYIGAGAAGHFVKMVHNGIEYGDMQLIAESYHLLSALGGYSPPEMSEIYQRWNKGDLSSYLVGLTANVLAEKDPKGRGFLIDKVLDEAEQKGTGKWTTQEALNLGVPIPTITAAVDARQISAIKGERIEAAKILTGPIPTKEAALRGSFESVIESALLAAKIITYAQGMALLSNSSREYGWDLNLSEIAGIWRNGCIIRASLLSEIRSAFANDPECPNMMCAGEFSGVLAETTEDLRRVVSTAISSGVPVPALSSALAYYDAYRTARLPQNLIQLQRERFGGHGFKRIDS